MDEQGLTSHSTQFRSFRRLSLGGANLDDMSLSYVR